MHKDKNIGSRKVSNEDREIAARFHERARLNADEFRKLLISLSTGILALYFIALTTEVKPPLSNNQKYALLIGLLFVGAAVFSGLLSWYADARRSYFYAKARETKNKDRYSLIYPKAAQWAKLYRVFSIVLQVCFAINILCSIIYIFFRIGFVE